MEKGTLSKFAPLYHCDLLISGGRIFDGSTNKSFLGDVGVSGDRIIAVGNLDKYSAETLIDGTDYAIAPGFIDTHAHDDYFVLNNREVTPKLSQGVTTVVIGNCGISLAPWIADRKPPAPMNLIGDQKSYCFPSFESYRKALEEKPPSINVASLIGHSTLRCATMDELNRPANAKETARMQSKLQASLKAGAIGFSTGLAYEPNYYATPEEVVSLAKMVNEYSGVYATHMRNEGDLLFEALEESFKTGRLANCPLIISHHKCASPSVRGRSAESLKKIESASKHQIIAFDVYPYNASSTILKEDYIDISEEILITWSESVPSASGKTLSTIADEWNCEKKDAIRLLQPGGGIYFTLDDTDVDRILAHPKSMVGSDGVPNDEHPHPRLWGTFPRILSHYVRKKKLLTLENAIHKMSGLSASTFQLRDRGFIRSGYFADIVIFNPDSITDRATYKIPKRSATGIRMVIVNGTIAWENNSGTGSRTGTVLQNQHSLNLN
tara:strand:+ start:4194 stop:5681 length:1488 start_codon:yes stop_codon:yes gene_type:complete